MLHIYQMILLLGTLPIFCCIQLFLVFNASASAVIEKRFSGLS